MAKLLYMLGNPVLEVGGVFQFILRPALEWLISVAFLIGSEELGEFSRLTEWLAGLEIIQIEVSKVCSDVLRIQWREAVDFRVID